MKLEHFFQENDCVATLATELPNGFAIQSVTPSKRNTDLPMYHRYPYSSSVEFSEKHNAAAAAVHLLNAC